MRIGKFIILEQKKKDTQKTLGVEKTVGNYLINHIAWKKSITSALGKNGKMKCIGLSFTPVTVFLPKTNNVILIEPINSKGNLGRCHIEIPKEDIPQVIEQLKNYYNSVS